MKPTIFKLKILPKTDGYLAWICNVKIYADGFGTADCDSGVGGKRLEFEGTKVMDDWHFKGINGCQDFFVLDEGFLNCRYFYRPNNEWIVGKVDDLT